MAQSAGLDRSPKAAAPAAVLAVDLDEVLGMFVRQLCLFHNDEYGTSLTTEDFNSYYFHNVWGGDRESADEKMNKFFKSDFFLGGGGIPPVHGAEAVLRKHAANFELHIVTSRQDVLQEHTREWVDRNYPGLFVELHFGNHFSTDGVQTSKPDLCKAIGAVLIIDDNVRYAAECAAAGIPAYLFGDYAWNRTDEPLPENVKRTVSWADVDAQLDALLESGGGGGGGGSNGSSSGGASNNTEPADTAQANSVSPASAVAPAAAVTAVVATAATAAATENGDVGGVVPPSDVVGEDVVSCAA